MTYLISQNLPSGLRLSEDFLEMMKRQIQAEIFDSSIPNLRGYSKEWKDKALEFGDALSFVKHGFDEKDYGLFKQFEIAIKSYGGFLLDKHLSANKFEDFKGLNALYLKYAKLISELDPFEPEGVRKSQRADIVREFHEASTSYWKNIDFQSISEVRSSNLLICKELWKKKNTNKIRTISFDIARMISGGKVLEWDDFITALEQGKMSGDILATVLYKPKNPKRHQSLASYRDLVAYLLVTGIGQDLDHQFISSKIEELKKSFESSPRANADSEGKPNFNLELQRYGLLVFDNKTRTTKWNSMIKNYVANHDPKRDLEDFLELGRLYEMAKEDTKSPNPRKKTLAERTVQIVENPRFLFKGPKLKGYHWISHSTPLYDCMLPGIQPEDTPWITTLKSMERNPFNEVYEVSKTLHDKYRYEMDTRDGLCQVV